MDKLKMKEECYKLRDELIIIINKNLDKGKLNIFEVKGILTDLIRIFGE